MEVRRAFQISQTVWEPKIFERKTFLDTSDIRREMGVTRKKGGSTVDAIQICKVSLLCYCCRE